MNYLVAGVLAALGLVLILLGINGTYEQFFESVFGSGSFGPTFGQGASGTATANPNGVTPGTLAGGQAGLGQAVGQTLNGHPSTPQATANLVTA